jgi:hypothetical protein
LDASGGSAFLNLHGAAEGSLIRAAASTQPFGATPNMGNKPRYQDFVNEQRAGRIHGVFVDDTGSPGLRDTPNHLHPERKSWVAVVVPRSAIAEVWQQFPHAIDELEKQTGATEFHFAEIYGGTREFKGVPLEKRLSIFAFMAHIFSVYNFPVFVQTLDPVSLDDIRARGAFPDRLGPFNFKRHEDLALFFLLLRVKWHLEQNYSDAERRARVFVDEGFQRNGAAIVIKHLDKVFADGLICFGRSDSILPIQLADFAAFCLNRTQLLLGRPKLSALDESFLRIIQPIAWNYQNVPQLPLDAWWPTEEGHVH